MNKNILYKSPKGTIDYFGDVGDKLNFTLDIIKDIFIKNGGEFLETPVFERKDVIMGKYGEEAESKLIYDIKENGGEDLVLRYDQTIPFIRFLIENKINKIKRYSIGKVYRRDNPNISKGRFREFYQADFDIVGEDSNNMISEFVIFNMINEILTKLGIINFTILVNNTENLKSILIDKLNIDPQNFKNICSSIDKLDKVKFKDIINELKIKGLTDKQISDLEKILIENNIHNNKFSEDLNKIMEYADIFGFKDKIKYDIKLARGLDYYNGIIFEVKIDNLESSYVAGGRYDNIINNTTFIGFSVGVTRILDLVRLNNSEWKEEYYLTTIGEVSEQDKFKTIKWCKDNLTKNNPLNFSYGKDKKLNKILTELVKEFKRYVIIIGENEIKENKIILKDLKNSSQEIIIMI